MKRLTVTFLFITLAAGLFAQAQQQTEVGQENAAQIGIAEAQQKLKEISVDKFEMEGFWRAVISYDEGYTAYRLFEGGPAAKVPVPEEQDLNIPDKYVFGVRVDFIRRGINSVFVRSERPLPIEGITKTVSVWVAGRNFNHTLNLLLEDVFGRYYELYMGKLNFQGWKKMTVAIPPQAVDGLHGIIQRNYHYGNQMLGIKILGFRIDCDPADAYGSYYVYFDDLRAVTDLFAEDVRDADDPNDSW
ncbi:MAG: flagellar filament outer layer protein FlaA [Treponema sp.]|jgi:hypothetical protein|nr:flagellar filament outer layer protein FlaA [Treponema sp.]